MFLGGALLVFFALQVVFLCQKNYFCEKHIAMSKFIVTLTVLALLPSVLFSQKHIERGYRTILSSDARLFVETLASDPLQGRCAGEEGGRMAAEYIVSLLSEWGVDPLGDNGYMQPFVSKDCGMNNVLAVIPGRSREYVVIGAHYDHVGIGLAVDGDSCYNGADDNASGVSAVLQIARAVKKMRRKPERGIIFAFWDGEEKGLLGSRYFVENCPFLSDISAYMNFDMIGRGPVDNPKHLTYFYTASHAVFGDWLREDMAVRGFSFIPDYRAWDNPTGGSDNAYFAKNGIPIVWYHTEGHPDYHQPSDTADKIDYEKMVDITRAAFLCVWRLANEKY